jgi:Tfp pilus assembly protein PilV
LIEVLVALAIFSVGILAVASMQAAVINGNATARFSNEASVLAQEQLERLIALPFDPSGTLPPELDEANNGSRAFTVNSGGSANADGPYTIDWTVSALHVPVDNAVTIELTVTWQERSLQRRVRYRYVKTESI